MNLLLIAGGVGKDAELRTTQNGKKVLGFSVGVSGRDKETTWFDCSLWGERGEKLAPYIKKGGKVTVSGQVSAREYNGKAYLQVFVHDLTLQGGKPQASGSQHGSYQEPQQGEFGSGGMPIDDIPFAAQVL